MSIGPGTHIGPYEVQDFVGQGAMGVVYKAWHDGLGRPAAVKVLQTLAPDHEAVSRFRREAQSIAQMRHPNILHVFDFGQIDGVPYMIVEYVPGGSLADRMRTGRLNDGEALALLRGIAAGLDYAHGVGVVHRDVKPANVLLAADGTPILADFGLAKLLQSSSVKSATGVTTGTPAYMAPEQVTASGVGPAADRYALAAVAYEMLTGTLPFDAEGVLEVLYAHVHRDPIAPSARRSDLPPEVDAVLAKGLAKAPEDRWASCGEIVEALAAATGAAPVGAPVTPPVANVPRGTSAATVALAPIAAAPTPPSSPGPRRRLPLLLGAAAAVIAVLLLSALGYAVAYHPGATAAPTPTPLRTRSRTPVTTATPSNRTPVPTPTPSARTFHPTIAVSPLTPKPGTGLTVAGRDFDPTREYSLLVRDGTATDPLQTPGPVQSTGVWTAHVTLPSSLAPGTGVVIACIYTPGQATRAEDCAEQEIAIQKP